MESSDDTPTYDRDEDWEYSSSGVESSRIQNVTDEDLEEPRTAISKYVPLVEYDSEERSLTLTTRL